jgi:hypothetical protein
MRRTSESERRWTRAAVVTVLVALAASCGSDEGKPAPVPPVDATYVAPPADAATALLGDLAWDEVTLDVLLARFDVNGDGVIDAKDRVALAACIDAGAALDGSRCDLVPDGVVDEQDGYLLSLVVGEVVPRSAEAIHAAAAALHASAKGALEPDLSGGFFDWNHDGKADASDVERLATVLEGDLAALDLDGDGLVAFSDAAALAVAQARAKFADGPEPTLDLDGSGASDSVDVALLGQVALYTSETSFGLLDVNQDAKIDLHDFCVASAPAAPPGLLTRLLPAAKAAAAFAAEAPLFAVCRADGRPMARNVTRLDTPFVAKLLPRNLYLEPVAAIPAGYAPVDPSIADGRQLFIVSTAASDRRLAHVSLPWDVTLAGGDDLVFGFTGAALPDAAALVLPGSIVPLDVPVKAMAVGASSVTEVAVPLPDVMATSDVGAAEALAEGLAAAKTLYDELIAGCPCSLAPEKRDELVRYLLRASNCLGSTLSVAQANLSVAELDLARLARLSVSASNEAAGRQVLLSDDYVCMEITKTLLLIAESGYDFLSGGPKKALKGAVDNLVSELATDHLIPAPESMTAATAESVGAAFGASTLSDVIQEMVKSKAASGGVGAFSKEFISKAREKLPKADKQALEGLTKTLIKLIPVYYLEYQKLVAEDALNRSNDYAAAYHEAVMRVASLRSAIAALTTAKATIDDLRKPFLAKLQNDGCGVSVSTADPCSFDLENAIAAAGEDLAAADAAAASSIEQAYTGAGGEGTPSACTDGPARRDLDGAKLAVAGAARALTQHVRAQGSASALADLEQRLHDASDAHREARDEFAGACDLFAEVNVSPERLNELRDAEAARQEAYDDFRQAVTDALAAYDACLKSQGQSASACAFDPTVADASPLASGAICVGCLPSAVMNCCGDGKVQGGEECDPGAAVDACSEPKTCDAQCQCQGSGVSVPPSVYSLADRFGVVAATLESRYQPLDIKQLVHSSASVPPKAVAGDHTTITGLFAGTVTLDQATIDGFSCGAGPGPGDFTVCPSGGLALPPGVTLVIIDALAGPMPLTGTGDLYQYGFVFDANGVVADNYTPSPQYPNDFFGGTDLWIEANRTAAGAWSAKATNAAGGSITAATTSAHVFISGSAIGALVPASELSVALPSFRVTAFRHSGDYGMNPPHDYDGSVHPAVADGLAPFAP